MPELRSDEAAIKPAESLLERGKYTKALAEFEQVIADDPDDPRARLGAAVCAIGLREFDRGLQMLRQLDPLKDPDLRVRRVRAEAWALLLQKKWDKALAWLDEELPDLREVDRAGPLLYRVNALFELKRRAEAAEALREAWAHGSFRPADLRMSSHYALLLGETAIAHAACRRMMRTKYALGAALLWAISAFSGQDRLLVLTPVFLLLTIGAPLTFGILTVLAAWGMLVGITVLIGLTHRMPYIAIYGFVLAAFFGGMSGLLALLLHPSLGGPVAGGLMLVVVVVGGFLIVRSNRRYRKRLSQSTDPNASPGERPQRERPEATPTATTEPAPRTHTPRRSRLVYLVWPVTLLLLAGALCTTGQPAGSAEARFRAVSEGIEPARIAFQQIELGTDDVRIGLFVADLTEEERLGGTTRFTARLISRGDYPLQDIEVFLIPRTRDGLVVEVISMDGDGGTISPGEELTLSAVLDPDSSRARIVEETLSFPGDNTFNYTDLLSPRESPTPITRWLGEHVGWITYSAAMTHPDAKWATVGVEVRVGEVVED